MLITITAGVSPSERFSACNCEKPSILFAVLGTRVERKHQPGDSRVSAQGVEITSHQLYLDAIADKLNDRRRATLGYLTPREVFTKLLTDNVASTG